MDWTPDNLLKARALLAEDKAVLVQKGAVEYSTGAATGDTRKGRQKIVRLWPQISDRDRALCDAYLLEYASASNTQPGRIVHGPQADRETFPGDWRMTRTDLSRLKTDPREQGVYQTLVFPADASGTDGGYPSEETHLNHTHTEVSTGSAPAELPCGTPPQGTRLSANARLDRETGEWESEVRTDEARSASATFTDGDALSRTTHTVGEHQFNLPAEPPGSGKIVRKTADIDEYGTYRTQVSVTTPVADTLSHTSEKNALRSVSTVRGLNADKAPDAKDGETVTARRNEFGKVDYEKHTVTPKPAEAQAEAAEWSEKTVALAYQNADAEKSAIPGVADSHAIVPGATAHRNEFGKVDGSVTVTVPIERQSGPHTVEQTALRKVESTFHFNKASVPPATSSGGTVTTYNPRVNRFGLIDYEERKTSPGTQGKNAWKRIYQAEWWTEHVYTMEFRNWTDIPKIADFGARDPLADKGVLSNHNVNYNDLDLFDGHLVLTVPVEQEGPEVVIEDSDQRTVTVQAFFNQEQQPPADTSTPGSVTTYNARQNRFGLWDYEKRTTTFKPKEGTEYTSEDSWFETVKSQQRLNQETAAEAKMAQGTIQTVHNRLNDAGLYDTETRTEKAQGRATPEIVIEDTPERKVTIQQFHNQRTKPADATHSASKSTSTIYSGVQLNRFGLYDYEKHKVEDKGSLGKGTGAGGVTYYGPWQRGVKVKTTVSSSKGWSKTSYTISQWRMQYKMIVRKHTTAEEAYQALSGAQDVHSASVSQGGTGVWYSHLITATKVWK